MTEPMLVDLLVFCGLMATLGAVTKVFLSIVQRRRGLPTAEGKLLEDIAGRLTRLEQVADATAIEVERIGEGQRFTTKLLGDRGAGARD